MKNSEYWQERFKQLEAAQNALGKKAFAEIEKQYRSAIKDIEADIDKWYRRFAENNNISMAEARKWLTGKDLTEFKWSVQEYIKYGEEHALKGGWAKELENASAKFHISRLDALKINTKASLERLFTDQNEMITGALEEVFRSGYYHTAFELQKGFGVGFDVGQINNDYLSKVLSKPWAVDGKNFSERIWGNKEKLINEIHKELSQNIITGADPQKAIDAISRKLNVSKSNAGRLVMTEEAYFSSVAQKECFNDLGVDKYEIVAALDDRTSEICQEMDGKVFDSKDREEGVNAPPFHVNCRSTTCPYFDDEFSLGERAARDGDGQTYYVPSDMKYPEWKEKFLDGGDKEGLKKAEGKKYVVERWKKVENSQGVVSELRGYTVNGVTYEVDGKHVVLNPSEHEKEIANLLASEYGKKVEIVPQVMFPLGVQTPDYLINGERFDLKTPTGKGKYLIQGLIAKKRKQSHSFIIDLTVCPLEAVEIDRQIDDLFVNPRTGFLEKIILIKNKKVIKAFLRK